MKKQRVLGSSSMHRRLLLVSGLCFLVQLTVINAQQNSTCNTATEQPVVTGVNPPSGTIGQDAGVSSTYTIQGELLDRVAQFELVLLPPLDTENRMQTITLSSLERNSSAISFRVPRITLVRTVGGNQVLLRIYPDNPTCQNISLSMTLHETTVAVVVVALEATPGTTIITGSGTCVPNLCGDNSTSFNFEIGGIILEQYNISTDPRVVIARFPNFNAVTDSANFIIATQYQEFDLPVSNNFELRPPGMIASVVPSRGQKGTRVAITGQNLLGSGGSISLSRVLLGGIEAEITGSRTDKNTIEIRAGAGGMLGNVSLTINTTHAFPQVPMTTFDGPYIFLGNAWTQLEDGFVREVVPPAAQPGETVLLCGDRLLGGGTTLDTVQLASQTTAQFNTTPSALNSSLSVSEECITAVVPTPSGGAVTGSIVLTADTGAEVESLTNFTFASIDSVEPMSGQAGTLVTIQGVALLSGYETATPTVLLSGVQAEVLNYNSTTIVARAVTPPEPQGSGIILTLNDLFGTPGDVSIIVSANFTSSTTFSVSVQSRWTYLAPGEITTISPNLGQFRTRIMINGSNLLGYGASLLRATIGSVEAIIESAAESRVVLLTPDLGSNSQNATIVLFSDSGAQIRGENLFEYREQGNIASTTPAQGQNGTYIAITGSNLFGYGNNITNVSLGSVEATIDYFQANNTLIVVRASALNNTAATSVPVTIVADTFAVVTSSGSIWTYLVPGEIDTVSPGQGQEGTIIEIRGTNLLGGGASVDRIFLDDVQADVENATATRIVVTMRDIGERVSAFFPGQVYIVADTGAIVFGGAYTHRPSGQITTFSPQRGRRRTRITLSGINLLGFGNMIVQVLVAGMPSTIESFDNSSATIRAGNSNAGVQGPIQLIINTGAVITSTTNFTYEPTGMISEVVPRMGAEGSGVLIRGTSLSPSTSQVINVTIGGNPVSRIVTAAETEISVIVGPAPSMDPNNAAIVITSGDGSVVDGEVFTFLNLVISLPGQSRGQEGTYIDIQLPNTQDFEPSLSMRVTIDDQEAEVTGVNTTLNQITVRVPRARRQGTFSVDVAVESLDRLVARLRNGFTYLPEGTVFTIDPSFGQRGTRVVIRGSNLLGGGDRIDTASLVGVPGNVVNSTNESIELEIMQNLQSASYPQLGDIILMADTGATVRRLNGFTLVQPGKITSASPVTGQFGTRVTVNGRNLLQGTSSENVSTVLLSGVAATIIGNSTQTQIVVEASTAASGTPGPIEVILTSGARVTSPAGVTFQYLEAGVITTVTPNSGPVGTRVIIRGTGLLGGGNSISQVWLGDVQAVISGFSNTQINVTANEGTPGSGDIIIISNTGTTVNGSGRWNYEELGFISQISPTIGQRGVVVTITGQRLLSTSSTRLAQCLIAGIAAQVMRVGRTEVTCEAGRNPISQTSSVTGSISLTTDTGVTIMSTAAITNFTYYQSNIDRIEPTSGNSGTVVTISGTNLYGYTESNFDIQQIIFGNVQATVLSRTLSSIQVRIGASEMATTNETVTIWSTSGAIVELSNAWSFTQPRTFSEISASSGRPGEQVYLYGQSLNLASATSVTVTVGGIASQSAQVINDSTIQFTVGIYQGVASTGVNLPIRVVYSTGETLVNSSVTFAYNTTEGMALSLSPQAGSGQETVTIRGTSLLNNGLLVRVTLAGTTATILNAMEEIILLEAGPSPSEGSSGPVVIERVDGTLIGLAGNAWTYYPAVMSSDVSPRTGQNGTVVTIDLLRLSSIPPINRVTLTGVPGTDFALNTSNGVLLVIAGPSNLTADGDITIEFNDNSILRIPNSWSYQSPVQINNVSPGMLGYFNTSVVLSGANFQAGQVTVVSVTLAGIQTMIESQNNTQIHLRIVELHNTTADPIVGPIVIVSSQEATFISSNNFTYVQVIVDAVSPQQGQRGTRVTVSGDGVLLGGMTVMAFWLGGVRAIVRSANDSLITVEAAAFPMQTNLSDVSYIMNTGATITISNSWRYIVPGEILSVTPTEGSMGTLVTIMGTNLLGGGERAEMVILNSVPATEIVVDFDSLIQVVAGPSTTSIAPGNVQIISDTGAVTESTGTSVFQYLEPGRITTVSPDEGQNGTDVRVMGSFLHNGEGIRRVLLAGIEAEIVSINEDDRATGFPATINLVARRPSSLASFSGPVVIESNFNTITVSSLNFTYLAEGLILAVSPTVGQNGTNVVITGQDLTGGGSSVQEAYLSGVRANILSQNQTTVVVRASESALGQTGDVLLVSNTNAYVRRIDGWTYVAQGAVALITPEIGQFGTRVNISGQWLLLGASNILTVSFNNISAYEIVSVSEELITIRVGRPTSSVAFTTSSITIESDSGGVLYQDFLWNFTDPSRITDVSPPSGKSLTDVTVSGVNLLGGGTRIMSVTVAGIPATLTAANSTIVTFRTGLNIQGSLLQQGNIVIEADNGARTESPSQWRYVDDCPPGTYGTTNNCRPCHEECSLCRGPTDLECLRCHNFSIVVPQQDEMQCVPTCANVSTLDRECRDACELNQYARVNSTEDQVFCYNCSDLCDPNRQCSGPNSNQCGACRNFYNTLNGSCVEECPVGTYSNESSSCLPCDRQCAPERGCYGSSNAECFECINVRVSANLIDDSGSGLQDICLERCPSHFYLDPSTLTCLPCASACALGCTGPSPFECIACLNNSFVYPNGSRKCVLNCNPNSTMQLFYDDTNSICQRCDDRCSKTGGCSGPTASNCIGCDTPMLSGGECVISCNNTHYHDTNSSLCVPCHESCTVGCTGTTQQDCIVPESTAFNAGAGTIAIVIIIILVLVIIVGLLMSFLIWMHRRYRRGKYTVGHEGSRNSSGIELGDRYAPARETMVSSNTNESVGIVNNAFGNDDVYTEAGPDNDDGKVNLNLNQAPEVYIDMSSPDMKKSEGETGSQDLLYTDMSPAPIEQDEIKSTPDEPVPARPPKPGEKPKEEKPPKPDPHIYKVPVKRGDDGKPPMKAPPDCPPSPEMYTDMRGGIQEVHLNPSAGLSQELCDDVHASTPESPRKKGEDQAPLLTPAEDFYEDTETAANSAQQYLASTDGSSNNQGPPIPTRQPADKPPTLPQLSSKSRISSTPLPPVPIGPGAEEQPPALPQRPVPKKRHSGTPLPQTPLQKSLSSSSVASPTSPTASVPMIDDIYEDTVPPEEMLYEPIPAREQLISDSSSNDKAGKGSKQKGGKKKK